MFVTRDTAFQEMQAVKERFGKTGGNVAYHAYQSFMPREVTPELCHQLGVELAQKMWGDEYQVLVATHFNDGNTRGINTGIGVAHIAEVAVKLVKLPAQPWRTQSGIQGRAAAEGLFLSGAAPGNAAAWIGYRGKIEHRHIGPRIPLKVEQGGFQCSAAAN